MLRQKFPLVKRTNIFKFQFASAIVFLIVQINYAQTATIQNPPETALEPGKKIERETARGEKQIFQVAFAADQYEKIIVEQKGVDIIAKILDADGKSVAEYDSEWRVNGAETIEFTNGAAQTYRVEISPKYKMLPAGKFEINFAESRPATEKDKSLQEARNLYNQAVASRRAGKSPAAIPLAVRASEIFERNSDAETADAAIVSSLLGNLYAETSDYEKAEAAYQKTLAIRTKVLGETNPLVALTIGDMGVVYRLRGEPERALPLYQKSLAIREQSFGREHPEVARMMQSIGNLSFDAGDYVEARKYYEQALAIREKTLEPTNSSIASVLNGLALIAGELGDNVKAEQMYLRVLDISEKTLPPEHPSIAIYLDNLAGVYREMGDLEKAEPMFKRALAIREKSLGAEDIMVSASLNNVGNFYQDKKDYAEAEKAYSRSLEIREKKFQGKPHPWIVQSLYNLGDLHRVQFDLVKAEDYMLRALAVAEKIPGANNPSLTYALTGLASVYTEKGEYDKAEPLFRRVLKIYDETLGAEHPTKAKILTALATLYLAKKDFPAAVNAQKEANRIVENKLALNLALGSEQKKLDYLATLSEKLNRTLTISFYAGNEKNANEMALTNILQRKGRVLDAMADTLSVLRRRFDEKDRGLLDNLSETNAKLALLVLSETPRENPSEQGKQVGSLEEKRDQLENEISRRAAGFYEKSKPVTLEAVRQLIPEDAALVEFAVFQPYLKDAKNNTSDLGEARYVAYIVGRAGDVQMKDLGKAAEIDSAIENFRQALHDPARTDAAKLGRATDEKIWKPLGEMLGDKKQILVSPDGELNLIPFEALVDEQNKYLVENYSFTYLSSGRDLLRMQTARTSKDKPLLIANPLFGAPLPEATAQVKTTARNKKQRSITAARDLSETYFAPLGGTVQEARSIQTLFPDATLLSQSQATETALKKVNAPRILHIATHGFFLEDENSLVGDDKTTAVRRAETDAKIENPLLRSGLALAGANKRSDKGDDGILTALEASGLNLWGTKLVVLSACDTGLGEVKNGEGVYGLRRSFTLAGAETLVMSLWSVSDYVTRELMTDYYKNLKQGTGRGAALREAQLTMLKRRDRQHPFFWAAFIQSGEWANLDGKR